MRIIPKSTLAGIKTVLVLSNAEMAALRRAEAIAEKMRDIAREYEEGVEGSQLDEDLARCEHGAGNLADEGPEFTLEYEEIDLTAKFVADIAGV